MQNNRRPVLLLSLLAFILAGCIFPGVYRINVQQGNIVEARELERLRPGMQKAEVHQVLGTPLAVNTVDPSRDYYVYSIQKQGGEIERQKVVIFYDQGKYVSHRADLLEETPAY